MRPIAEGSQRELLLTALVMVETGEVTDRELAERFARLGLLRDRQVARGANIAGAAGLSASAQAQPQTQASNGSESSGSAGAGASGPSAPIQALGAIS
jgi:hypothetical protein